MVRRVPSHATAGAVSDGGRVEARAGQSGRSNVGRRKSGSEGPAIGNLMLLKPRRNRLLAFIRCERIFVRRFCNFGIRRGGHGDERFPVGSCEVRMKAAGQALNRFDRLAEMNRGSAGRRGGIIQLMSEPRGHRAQRDELLALLREPFQIPNTRRHRAQNFACH